MLLCLGLTNQERYRAEYLKRTPKIADTFDIFFSSAEIGIKKPDPQFYHFIKDAVGFKFEDSVYWDDEGENVLSARNLGINSYLYTSFSKFKSQIKENFNV